MAAKSLTPVIETNLSGYAYPDGAQVFNVQNEDVNYHQIYVTTDVSGVLTATDGTGFGNAPKGSQIFQYLAGAVKLYGKNTSGAWVSVTLS